MAININTILQWFKAGKKPTEQQFADSWQSFWHKDETIPQGKIQNLQSDLNLKADSEELEAHLDNPGAHGIASLQNLVNSKITNGGDSPTTPLVIGTKNSQSLSLLTNTTERARISSAGIGLVEGNAIHNLENSNQFKLNVGTATESGKVTREMADAYPAFTVHNAHNLSTGNIMNFTFNNSIKAAVRNDGRVYGAKASATNDFVTLEQVNNFINKRTVKQISTPTYILQSEDSNKMLHFLSACVVTVPTGLPINVTYSGLQLNTGQVTFVNGTGAVLITGPSDLPQTAEQYSLFSLDWISPETYLLYGKLEIV